MVPWSTERKRAVLNRFAKQHNFNPQNASSWYSYTHRDVAVSIIMIIMRKKKAL